MFDLLDYLSLILIFVFGVPHGAFDASIALTLGYYKNLKSKFYFIFCYGVCVRFYRTIEADVTERTIIVKRGPICCNCVKRVEKTTKNQLNKKLYN